jgi:dTDP-4-dehydrorhamnose 3,5-epimerase-like enzyme
MRAIPSAIAGLLVIEPAVHGDERGDVADELPFRWHP